MYIYATFYTILYLHPQLVRGNIRTKCPLHIDIKIWRAEQQRKKIRDNLFRERQAALPVMWTSNFDLET